MREFSIAALDGGDLERKIESKTQGKAGGLQSLGRIGEAILCMALVQKTESPKIKRPSLLVFAADHGFPFIPEENVPTYKLVLSYLNDHGVINTMCRKSNIHYKVVDVGVDHSFESMLTFWLHHGNKFIHHKIGMGTRDFSQFPAMSSEQCLRAMTMGEQLVKKESGRGTNILLLGNLGTGNISSAMALYMALTEKGIAGKGDPEIADMVDKAVKRHPKTHDPFTILTLYGGYEIAATVGALLKAAELRMTVLLDGPVNGAALLLAHAMNPNVKDYVLITDSGIHPLEKQILHELSLRPLFQLGVQLGEGCASAMAFALIKSSLNIFHNLYDPGEEA